MRLIDADALMGMDIKIGHIGEKTVRAIQWATVDAFYRNIGKSPTVDAVPVVRGEWVSHYDDLFPMESTQECSACHEEEFITLCNDKYCPNCGAKMESEA